MNTASSGKQGGEGCGPAHEAVGIPKTVPDPGPTQPTNRWKVIAGLAVGFGIVLLAALAPGQMFLLTWDVQQARVIRLVD